MIKTINLQVKFFLTSSYFFKDLQKQLFDVKNENRRLEKQFLIKQSQNAKIEDLKDRQDKLIQENQDYRSQLTLLSDQILIQDNKTLDLENSIKELRNSINERDEVFSLIICS